MLLEQPGGPLIVDQPEGDLDNKSFLWSPRVASRQAAPPEVLSV
jgi:hypothetical protein